MKSLFRIAVPLVFVLLSTVLVAQKKDLTFSDRTGIKGVQFSLGNYRVMNPQKWDGVLRNHVREKPAKDSVYLSRKPFESSRALLQLELVYAPFRFNSNSWLRNIEIFGGISHRSFETVISTNRGGAVNERDLQYFERDYLMQFNHTAAQVRVAVNKSILPSTMVYGSFGYGLGLSSGLRLWGSNTSEWYYSYDTVNGTYSQSNFLHQEEQVFYQSKGITQQSVSLGLKVYLSCRINLYAEYGLEFLQIRKPGTPVYRQNSHGFQIGLRFKFNPPEPLEEEDKVKPKNVFW